MTEFISLFNSHILVTSFFNLKKFFLFIFFIQVTYDFLDLNVSLHNMPFSALKILVYLIIPSREVIQSTELCYSWSSLFLLFLNWRDQNGLKETLRKRKDANCMWQPLPLSAIPKPPLRLCQQDFYWSGVEQSNTLQSSSLFCYLFQWCSATMYITKLLWLLLGCSALSPLQPFPGFHGNLLKFPGSDNSKLKWSCKINPESWDFFSSQVPFCIVLLAFITYWCCK